MRSFETRVLRKRISTSLTGDARAGEVVKRSLVMALGAALFAAPYFHRLIHLSSMRVSDASGKGLVGFLFMELFLLFILSLLCAVIGFSFAGRRGLPGLGDRSAFVRDAPWLFFLGLSLMALSIIFFDRRFYEVSPSSYPRDWLSLATFPLKRAFTDEIILRLGLVTVGAGLFRHRAAGVILAALLAVVFSMKTFQFLGVDLPVTGLLLPHFLITFLANLLLGYLFVTRGLLHAMGLGFFLGLKYAVMAWAF